MKIKHALVVDDSKSARFSLKKLLEQQGLEVSFAESAGDALNYLETKSPDVIFMDHFMPGMDGFEATTIIKNNPATSGIPVVMCTSKEGPEYAEQAMAKGATAILPKPVPADALVAVFEKIRELGAAAKVAPAAEAPAHGSGEIKQRAIENLVKDLVEEQLQSIRLAAQEAVEEQVQAYLNSIVPTLKESLASEISLSLQPFIDKAVASQAEVKAGEVFDSRAGALQKKVADGVSLRLDELHAEVQSAKTPSAELLVFVKGIVDDVAGNVTKQLKDDIQKTTSLSVSPFDLVNLKEEMRTELKDSQPKLGGIKMLGLAGIALGAAALILALM